MDVHGFILPKVAAVPRAGAWLSLPLSARENADLMDFLSFIRWLAGQEKMDLADNPRNRGVCTSGCAFGKPLGGTFTSRSLSPTANFASKSSVDINKQTNQGITVEPSEGARSAARGWGEPCAFVLNNETAVIENI